MRYLDELYVKSYIAVLSNELHLKENKNRHVFHKEGVISEGISTL